MSNQSITLDDIYALFRESEQQRKESQQAYEERQRESQQAFEEHQRAYKLEMAELRQIVAQTDKQIAQTNKQLGGLTSRWGEFVENLVRPAAVKIFQEEGINVNFTALRVEAQEEQGSIEIDILAENTNEIVAIEVKSHLEVRDVKRFLQTLERFKVALPKYKKYKLYGAVAGINIDERADFYATREGLFLIKPAGDSVVIANSQNFKPKVW